MLQKSAVAHTWRKPGRRHARPGRSEAAKMATSESIPEQRAADGVELGAAGPSSVAESEQAAGPAAAPSGFLCQGGLPAAQASLPSRDAPKRSRIWDSLNRRALLKAADVARVKAEGDAVREQGKGACEVVPHSSLLEGSPRWHGHLQQLAALTITSIDRSG